MTDERDPKLSARYRDLAREEPPRALDDAILAASRRTARRRSWLYPAAAAAAVVVLALAVTVHVERERPAVAPPPAEAPARATGELARRDAAGANAMADRKEEQAAMEAHSRSAPAARAVQAERPLAALQMDEAPLPWLERIARLREAGKHEEADRALAEFRKRYPEFRIPEEMLRRVEKDR